ncbi:MAG: hypothetical protein IE927_07770 [Rhodobacterales bacterium]|nr:hypothetical protein [Rhodobacterales bacterium]
MSEKKGTPINRRAFFGVAATGAAATAMGVGHATPVLAETGDERTRARYQQSKHVETYYRVNRYYPRGNN